MRGRFNRTICDTTTGIIVPFARVEVFEQASGTKPDLFSVETGGSPISNPMTATALGFAGFFLEPGQYRFVASTAGGTVVSEITHEVVVDPNANEGIFENIVAETFRGREIILEDIDFGRVLVRDIADHTHYAEFKYEAPGNRATLSRTGYIHFDMSPTYVAVYDQVGAPILKGETSRTRLYRGGAEVFNVDADALKIGFNASLDILFADISDSVVRIRNPNGTYPLSSAGGTLSLERQDGVDVLVSNSSLTNLARYDGGSLLTSTPSITALYAPDGSAAFDASTTATVMRYANGNPFATASGGLLFQYLNGNSMLIANSTALAILNPFNTQILSANSASTTLLSPAAQPVISATSTTTTINAGNGALAATIASTGSTTFDKSIIAPTFVSNVASTNYDVDGSAGSGNSVPAGLAVHDSSAWVNKPSSNNIATLTFAASAGGARTGQISIASDGKMYFRALHVSSVNTWRRVWDSVNAPNLMTDPTFSGNVTAGNFYGNGFNLTQLNASAVVNGTLPSNIFPSTIYTNTLHNISGSLLTLQSSSSAGLDVAFKSSDGTVLGAITAGYDAVGKIGFVNSGAYRLWINADGSSQASGSFTSPNFYGNGFNLTQLNASAVVNGTLPSNIFPATISAASITFSGNHIAKGGTAYNLLDITSGASILRNSAGDDVFNASTTSLSLKRANNILLNATSTNMQLFNHAGSIRANFDASNTQIFSPATAPFISATTTTAAITSGNGAACLSIDSTGAGLMKFPVYTVSTVPSASANADRVIIVSNASLGRGLYTSDGTNWRSAQSGTILS